MTEGQEEEDGQNCVAFAGGEVVVGFGVEVAGEDGAEFFHSPEQLGLDGTGGDVQYLGDLFVFDAFFLDESEDDAALLGQLFDGLLHLEQQFFFLECFVGCIGFQKPELVGIFHLDEVDVGVFFQVIEGLVLYRDVQICVNITHFGQGFSVEPAFYENVGDDLLCHFLLVEVHHGKLDQWRVEKVEEGFKCFGVIMRADEFPQSENIDIFILQSS